MPPRVQTQSPRPTTTPTRTSDPYDVWGSIDTLRLCVFGESGSGKTTFWSTFPGPITVFICSGGDKPGELRSINTPEMRRKVKPVVIEKTGQVHELLEALPPEGTVVLDHLSGFADLTIKEILGLDKYLLAKFRAAGKGESWSVVSQQQYGQSSIMCKEALRVLLNFPGNVVVVAQQRTFGGKDDGVGDVIAPTVGPAVSPSVAGWLMPACDFVVHAFKRPRMETVYQEVAGKKIPMQQRGKGVEYCLRTEPHDVYMTKFRLPKGHVLPDCIVDPSYDKLMRVIRGEK